MRRPLIVAAVAVSLASVATPVAAHPGHPGHPAPPAPPDAPVRVAERLADLAPGWKTGDDVLVTGRGDEDGFHLYAGAENAAYAFRHLATIKPFPADDDWLGDHCLTGDRKHVVVNLITRRAVNRPAHLARGGLVYTVSLADGRVRPVASGAAVNSASLRCGAGGRAAVVSYSAPEAPTTTVFAIDAARATARPVARLDGQYVDPVLDGDRVYLRQAGRIVRVAAGEPEVVHEGRGRVELGRVRGGVLEFAERTATGTALRELRVGTRAVTERAALPDRGARLAAPPGGAARLVGAGVRDVSAEGRVALADPPKGGGESALVWIGDAEPLRADVQLDTGPRTATGLPATRMTAQGELAAAGNFSTPKCAVPRNVPNRVAYGATARQAAWAVDLASLNAIQGAHARPANHRQTGLPAYSPSLDFPVPALAGRGGRVPPVVMNGILAQESAYKHATWRSLPGSGGNPLIGDYYGAGGTLDVINYDNADCGYGIAQVTTGMAASDTSLSSNGKAKIAVDYAENIQRGMGILAEKWNQLHRLGVVMNDGDPAVVENWYLALWAYNSGVQPATAALGNTTGCSPGPTCTDRAGNWGLGWTNNPNNDSYRDGRNVFLRDSYADAARPWEWPYQERVLGWTETPIKDYKGDDAYLPATPGPDNPGAELVTYPDRDLLCRASNNCDPATAQRCGWTSGDLAYHCWWHEPVQMRVDCARECARSPHRDGATTPEPPGDNPWPPACGKGLPAGSIVVDEIPNPATNIFCSGVDWTSGGTFELAFGATAEGMPISVINFHQLAAGLGAHTWFAGNALPTDTARRVTGTWKPNLTASGTYVVRVHIPTAGASSGGAVYKIRTANGTVVEKVINQHEHFNHWKSLGVHQLGPGSQVQLSNVTTDDAAADVSTIAWDALALVPVSGTYHEDKVDQVAYFDENQNLDTVAPGSWLAGRIANRQSLYDWATDLTGQVVAKPVCAAGVMTDQCVRQGTKDVFTRWRDQVVRAGTDPVNHPRGVSIPAWMGFSNHVDRRPTSAYMPDWFLTDDLAFKTRTQATVSFVVGSDGRIVPGSEDVDYRHRTGNTHLPQYLIDLIKILHTEYGITPPDLSYDLVDANEHNHKATRVNATTTSVLQARAYRFGGTAPKLVQKLGELGPYVDCVEVHAAGGGAVGYMTALSSDYLTSQAERWSLQVADLRNAGKLPHGVAQTALDSYNLFFDPTEALGSPFKHAMPIWQELRFASCADLSLRRYDNQSPIAMHSYMPNQYLYRDGQAVNLDGTSRPTADPLWHGDYASFTALPPLANQTGPCGPPSDHHDPHEGNPWGFTLLTPPDANPSTMLFCSDLSVPDPDYG